jgi:hypothetical protein
MGCVMDLPVRRWLLRAEAGVHCWVIQYNFRVGKSGTGENIYQSFFSSPLLIMISPLLYNHLSPPPEECDIPQQTAHYHIFIL